MHTSPSSRTPRIREGRMPWRRAACAPAVGLMALGLGACGSSKATAPLTTVPGLSVSATTPDDQDPSAPGTATATTSAGQQASTPAGTATVTSTSTMTATTIVSPGTTASADSSQPHPGGGGSCTSNHLAASRIDQQGTAGTQHITIALRNTGSTPCTLKGFPGVSMVREDGRQVDAPADQLNATGPAVHLAPGSHTSFMLDVVQGSVAPGNTGCAPIAHAVGLRIYPPNERAAIFLRIPLDGCSHPAHLMTVTAVGLSD